MLQRPAQPCRSSISLGCAPQPCKLPSHACSPALQNLCSVCHAPKISTALQELCFPGLCSPACTISALPATPIKPAQHCTIFTLQRCAPKACQAGHPHTHYLCSA
jgi:hypothetical protein